MEKQQENETGGERKVKEMKGKRCVYKRLGEKGMGRYINGYV